MYFAGCPAGRTTPGFQSMQAEIFSGILCKRRLTSVGYRGIMAKHLRDGCRAGLWRDVRAVEGTGLENRRRANVRGFESHSLRHVFISVEWKFEYVQKYPRGRRGSPAKGVGWIKPARGFKSLLLRQRKSLYSYEYRDFFQSSLKCTDKWDLWASSQQVER